MEGTRNFTELLDAMPPERRDRISQRVNGEIDAALKYFWETYTVQPKVTYVGPSWCRALATEQTDRLIRRTNSTEERTWAQIADECPPECCIVLLRGKGTPATTDELTFGYMECP
jgi:hypothetical protein